jgi:5-oxoprolinase (ATP-hydrolysing)
MAEGFLKIAVENMANAIKKISIQKGYDVTNYMLNCFGGAGGQHACNVADSLGISNVMIHPYAGVLSAYGMGLAEIRSIREGHFEKNITNILDADNLIEILSSQAKKDLNDQDISDASIILLKNAFLHYKGSHQNLEIKFDTPENMRKSFEQEHKKRFGFFVEDREIFIEMLTVEAVGKKTENYDFLNPNISTTKANPIAFKKCM